MPTDATDVAEERPGLEFRLVVWMSPAEGWRARMTGGDAVERDFRTPFELARFVAWPVDPGPVPRPEPGLR